MIILPEDKAIISILSQEEAGRVFIALVSEDDDMPELSSQESIVYTVISARNKRISEKQSINGKKGGRPRKSGDCSELLYEQKTPKSQPNPKKPNEPKKASVSVTDTVTNTVKEKEPLSGATRSDIACAVIDYLNQRLGTSYKPNSKATIGHINARLNEGFTLDDFIAVIDKKADEWQHRPDMAQYLRPLTLFGTKFESYLNAPNRKHRDNDESLFFGDYFDLTSVLDGDTESERGQPNEWGIQ